MCIVPGTGMYKTPVYLLHSCAFSKYVSTGTLAVVGTYYLVPTIPVSTTVTIVRTGICVHCTVCILLVSWTQKIKYNKAEHRPTLEKQDAFYVA
jgi:hypothetical protein